MFGKKKRKENIKTYVDGKTAELSEVPASVPPLEPVKLADPVFEPQQQTEVMGLPEGVECAICWDYLFYADNAGVWHKCPRCTSTTQQTAELAKALPENMKISICQHCKAENQIKKFNNMSFVCASCKKKSKVLK